MTEKIIANFTLNENEGLRANFKLKEQETINAVLKISPNITEHDKLSGRDLPNQHPISAITGLETALKSKQDTIQDLSAIRTGAEKGNTAVQPNQLSAVATSGNYNDLSNKPTIPTKTSELTNNSDFTTKAYVDGLVGDIETLLNNINSGG